MILSRNKKKNALVTLQGTSKTDKLRSNGKGWSRFLCVLGEGSVKGSGVVGISSLDVSVWEQ